MDITDAITLKAINNLQNDPEFGLIKKKDKKKKLLTKRKETSNRYKGVKTLFLAQSFGKYKEASSSYPFPFVFSDFQFKHFFLQVFPCVAMPRRPRDILLCRYPARFDVPRHRARLSRNGLLRRHR